MLYTTRPCFCLLLHVLLHIAKSRFENIYLVLYIWVIYQASGLRFGIGKKRVGIFHVYIRFLFWYWKKILPV